MSAILHYQYSITHFVAKAKHFYREPAAKGRLPHRLLQTAGTGPAGSPSCGWAQRPAAAARRYAPRPAGPVCPLQRP